MVEAAVVMPIIILTIMLLIRIFTFYLEILCTGIKEHEKALELWQAYSGVGLKTYENEVQIEFARGGLLKSNLSKTIETKAYFYNEDNIVRGKYMVSNK